MYRDEKGCDVSFNGGYGYYEIHYRDTFWYAQFLAKYPSEKGDHTYLIFTQYITVCRYARNGYFVVL